MTNGASSVRLTEGISLPPAVETAMDLKADYDAAAEAWGEWREGNEMKILLWNVVRKQLTNAHEDDSWGGPSLENLLTSLGFELGSDNQLATVVPTWELVMYMKGGFDESMEIKELVRVFENTDQMAEDIPLFAYFGWELVLRKTLVEYHAQRLRAYLYDGDFASQTDLFPKLRWEDYQQYAESGAEGTVLSDAEGIEGLFDPLWSPAPFNAENQHSAFFEAYCGLDYYEQLAVMADLTRGLSSSSVGQLILSELVRGLYGHTSGASRHNFRAVELFDGGNTGDCINWGTQEVFDQNGKVFGLNPDTVITQVLALQLAPGFARAIQELRGEMEDSRSQVLSRVGTIVEDVGSILGPYTNTAGPTTASGFITRLSNNNLSAKSQLEDFTGEVLDDRMTAIHEEVKEGYLRAQGYSQQQIGQISDSDIRNGYHGALEADPDDSRYTRRQVESAMAFRRSLNLYHGMATIYGSVLYLAGGTQHSDWELTVEGVADLSEDVKTFADAISNSAALVSSFTKTSIDWDAIAHRTTIRDVENVTKADLQGELDDITAKLKDLDASVKQQLLSDIQSLQNRAERLATTAEAARSNLGTLGVSDDLRSDLSIDLLFAKRNASDASHKLGRLHRRLNSGELNEVAELLGRRGTYALGSLDLSVSNLQDALHRAGKATQTQPDSVLQSLLQGHSGGTTVESLSDVTDAKLAAATLETSLDQAQDITVGAHADELATNQDELANRLDEMATWSRTHADDGLGFAAGKLQRRVDEVSKIRRLEFQKTLKQFGVAVGLEVVGKIADGLDIFLQICSAVEALEVNDGSVAVGHGMQAVGIIGMLALSGGLFWAAVAVLIVGIGLSVFTQDSSLTRWMQYTYFGESWYEAATETGFDTGDQLEAIDPYEWGDYLHNLAPYVKGHARTKAVELRNIQAGSRSEKAWRSAFEAYTESVTNDATRGYFAAQVAAFFQLSNPFEVKAADIEADGDGHPKLVVDVEEPGEGPGDANTFVFGSTLFVRPLLRPPGTNGYVYLPIVKVPLKENYRIHKDVTVRTDVPASLDVVTTRDEVVNDEAMPVSIDRSRETPILEYLATVEMGRKEQVTIQGSTVTRQWISGANLEISLNDAWKRTHTGSEDEVLGGPLASLLQVKSLTLLRNSPADVEDFERFLLNQCELGVKVYHVPPKMASAAESTAKAKGWDLAKMMKEIAANPFATRENRLVDRAGYSRQWQHG